MPGAAFHHRFVGEHWVEAPLERVFAFFSDPRHLLLITPAALDPRLVRVQLALPAGVPSGVDSSGFAGVGSEISLSSRLFPYSPLRMVVTARIVEYEWGVRFRDLNEKSLLRWDHVHEFEAARRAGREGTVVRDVFAYEVGGLPAAGLVRRLFVDAQVRRMFAHRHRVTERLLTQPG